MAGNRQGCLYRKQDNATGCFRGKLEQDDRPTALGNGLQRSNSSARHSPRDMLSRRNELGSMIYLKSFKCTNRVVKRL